MSCISCICEKLGKCPVFSCIYLVDLSCIGLFFLRYIAYHNILFIEKCIIDRKKRVAIFSRFYVNIIALLACFRCFDL